MTTTVLSFITSLAWPAVVVFGICFFHKEISALLGRVREGAGLKFDPPVLPQASETTVLENSAKANGGALAMTRTPALEAALKMVRQFVTTQSSPEHYEEAYSLVAARAFLVMQFEQLEGNIWGSQLALLARLNTHGVAGLPLNVARTFFYDPASKAFPSWFANYPFESYIAYLQGAGVITLEGDFVKITHIGREYLVWRVEQGKPPKLAG